MRVFLSLICYYFFFLNIFLSRDYHCKTFANKLPVYSSNSRRQKYIHIYPSLHHYVTYNTYMLHSMHKNENIKEKIKIINKLLTKPRPWLP